MLAARVKIASNDAFYKQLYDDIASEASTAAQQLPILGSNVARGVANAIERGGSRPRPSRSGSPDNPGRRQFLADAHSVAADALAQRAENAAHNIAQHAQNADFAPITDKVNEMRERLDAFNAAKLQGPPPESPERREFIARAPQNIVRYGVPALARAVAMRRRAENGAPENGAPENGALMRRAKEVVGGAVQRIADNDAAGPVLASVGAGALANSLIDRGVGGVRLPEGLRSSLRTYIAKNLAGATSEHLERKRAREELLEQVAQQRGVPVDQLRDEMAARNSRPLADQLQEDLQDGKRVTRRTALARVAAHVLSDRQQRPTPYQDEMRRVGERARNPQSNFLGPNADAFTHMTTGDVTAEMAQPLLDIPNELILAERDPVERATRTGTGEAVDLRLALARLNKVVGGLNSGVDPLPAVVQMAIAQKMRNEGIRAPEQILELVSYALPQGSGAAMRALLQQNRIAELRQNPREWRRLAAMSDEEILAEAKKQVSPMRFGERLRRFRKEYELSRQLSSGPMSTQVIPQTSALDPSPRPAVIGKKTS